MKNKKEVSQVDNTHPFITCNFKWRKVGKIRTKKLSDHTLQGKKHQESNGLVLVKPTSYYLCDLE